MPGEPCELETVALVPHQVPQAGVAQRLGIVATHTLACNGSIRWKTLTVVESVPCGVNCRHSWCLMHKSFGGCLFVYQLWKCVSAGS